MFTDSHCHLTCDELYEQSDQLIANAKEAGVDQMLVICTNIPEYRRALLLKEKYPENIRIAAGFYPGDADQVSKQDLEDLEQACASGSLDVLGEIGLDYHWDRSNEQKQKELFIRQLKMAEQYDLPVSIHMRDASRDTMDILWEHAKTPVIFHCFSGSLPIMEEALRMNSLISFAGPITFKNNKQGPVNVAACPQNRILSETDSPYLSPVPYRGKENQPAYVSATTARMAEIRGESLDELNAAIRSNYNSLFQRKA